MKNSLLLVFSLFVVISINAQKTKPNTKPVAKPKATASPLKNLVDSASYGIGLSVVNFYRQQGISKINSAMVARAIDDIMKNKKLLLSDSAANFALMECMNQQQVAKSKSAIAAGEAFLATNKNKAGVTTTPSGLQYEIITQGQGPKPTLTDTVVCHYRGSFLDGKVFDESYQRGAPVEFPMTGVIRGWTEVLQLMPVGSKYRVYVPYQLGYGDKDYYSIPGGSLLIFEIELLSIKGK